MRFLKTAALCILAFSATTGAARPSEDGQTALQALDRPFLELVGYIEAPRGYGTVTGYADGYPPKPLTQMSLGGVMEWQRGIRARGADSTAVGRYQFMLDTLGQLASENDLDMDRTFDRRMQDYLARLLMHKCGFYDRTLEAGPLANCLAGTWAALPLVSGPERGQSRYNGLAGNHARTTPEVVMSVLAVRFTSDAIRLARRAPPERSASEAGFRVTDAVFGSNG